MPDDTTTGIPNPDKPGHWLVPPWRADAHFSDVVRHFLRYHPWGDTNTAHLLAYFEGYQAALDSAPTDQLTSEFHQRWCTDMRNCVGRCARLYREKLTAETKGNVSTLRTTMEARRQAPARQEMAS